MLRSRSRKFRKGRSWSRIFYLRRRNLDHNCLVYVRKNFAQLQRLVGSSSRIHQQSVEAISAKVLQLSSRFAASFPGISRLGSALMTLQ